jgi:signal transduction histidine kinase
MLDLPSADAAAAPPHWREAPLLNARLLLARHDQLIRADLHQPTAASPALLARLTAAAGRGEMLVAYDSSAEAWRLRHAGAAGDAQLWQLQSVADSRARLFSSLRGVLAQQLTEAVLHELRNPLNAMSLHADLMVRVLSANGLAQRMLPSVDVIKQRVGDLRGRQDAAVRLWLGDATLAEAACADLAVVVDESLRLLRSHLALHDVRLRSADLHLIGTLRLRSGAAQARLALMALLLMACAGAKQYRTADGSTEVVLQASIDGRTLCLELQAPIDGHALGREVADTDGDGLMAGLALLLEAAGITLAADPGQALTRLSLAMA